MTDRTADTADACHVKPPRMCMGCNADLTGAYGTRLYCDACNLIRDRKRMNAAKRRAYEARRASGEPRRTGAAEQRAGRHCPACFGMAHRRPQHGPCPKCRGLWAAEQNVCEAPTGGAWVWL